MAALQEVLAVLLGAEGEARSEIEESRNEAERVVRRAKDAFSQERERRLAAARDLGIHKSTLFRKMKVLGVSVPASGARRGGGRRRSDKGNAPVQLRQRQLLL